MIRKKRIIFIFTIILAFVIPYYFKYLLIQKKNKFINNIYFKSPLNIVKTKKCIKYNNLLKKSLDNSFSASIIDENGFLIGQYNQNKQRSPASNLKLISTAFVLDNFKLSETLNTSLYIDNKNNYYLIGSGDPDLSYSDIQKLISKIEYSNSINLNLLEINDTFKWPKGWSNNDKFYNYGSPITSLAINSNENIYKDINFLKNSIYKYLKNKYPYSEINIYKKEYKPNLIKKLILVSEINSNTLISLITLANAESHNFTAESLFKNASDSWNKNQYYYLKNWLSNKGLPTNNIFITDASGLSRDNKLTTNLIALFLEKMKYNKNFSIYNSSLSIMGLRGTLSNRLKNTNLSSKFFGKTGTLSNTFSLSGYLYKKDKPMVISIIQNSNSLNIKKVFKLLKDIYNLGECY